MQRNSSRRSAYANELRDGSPFIARQGTGAKHPLVQLEGACSSRGRPAGDDVDLSAEDRPGRGGSEGHSKALLKSGIFQRPPQGLRFVLTTPAAADACRESILHN